MKGNFSNKEALALTAGCKIAQEQIKPFCAAVAKQFGEIELQQKSTAVRAVMLGYGFHVVKNSLDRGQFRPWTDSIVTRSHIWTKDTAHKNVALYMRVWHAFLSGYKPSKVELLAIASGKILQSDPKKARGEAAKLLKEISDWVGERSISEVIADELKPGGNQGGGHETPTIAGEDPLWADTAEHLMGLRTLLLDPETMKRFTASQLNDIETQWASGLDQFRKLKAQLRA